MTYLFVELNDGGARCLGGLEFNDDVLSNLRRWAAGEDFTIELVGRDSGGTSTYRSTDVGGFAFRRHGPGEPA